VPDQVPDQVPQISATDLASRLDDVVLIDVRQAHEYDTGHVRTARLIPLHELADRLAEVPVAGEVCIICRSGSRSYMASEFLIEHGVPAVNVAGGVLAWVDSGLELLAGDAPA
jgi:rhodanese-related sulfurtransferase